MNSFSHFLRFGVRYGIFAVMIRTTIVNYGKRSIRAHRMMGSNSEALVKTAFHDLHLGMF